MKSNNTPISENDKMRLVGLVDKIKCNICKQEYIPNNLDISLNGLFYYKNCKQCRAHRLELKNKRVIKK